MYRGYVKLWRALLDKPVWINSTSDQRSVLIAILLMANHEMAEWEWQGKRFNVNPGEFITSIASLRKLAGNSITTQNVRSALKRFEKLEFLTNKSTKTGRLITIINWEVYQGVFEETNKQVNKDPTKTQQRPSKEVTTNKNDKNYKNKTIEYPEWLNIPLWKEFKKYRTKIKAPLTDHAEKLCLADLKKVIEMGENQTEVVNQTIMSGKWKSFFSVRNKAGTSIKSTYNFPECGSCGARASSVKKGKECPFCGEIA